jgi:glycerophosphoryl diester phosphodiesterase
VSVPHLPGSTARGTIGGVSAASPERVPRPSGPEVVAHRGSSVEKPEHTLSAYLRAIEHGADALECDVRLTADNHLVCVHDRRVNRTSNGRGLVSTLELAHLENLDWGSWKATEEDPRDTEAPDRDSGRLLTLRRLLDAVRDCGRPVRVVIETKHPTRYAGQVERRLAEVLASYGWARSRNGRPPPVRMMSFSQLALARMRQLAPDVPRVLLVEERVPLRFREGALPRGVEVMGLDIAVLRRQPGFAERLHSRGHRLHVWTVDEPADVDLCVRLGVDAIITNRPGEVLAHLGRRPA